MSVKDEEAACFFMEAEQDGGRLHPAPVAPVDRGAHGLAALMLVIGAAIAVALTAVSEEVYDAVVAKDGVAAFDRPVLDAAIGLRTPVIDHWVTWFTDLGGPIGMPIIAVAIVLVMVLRWRSWTPPALMLAAVAGSLAMTTTGKAVIGRVRPPLSDAVPPFESSPSFPSGHALNSTVIAGLVAYLLVRRLDGRLSRTLVVVAAVAWALAMGLSRVFLGHHWLTDVMAAWTLGLAWLTFVITVHQLFLLLQRSRRRRVADGGEVPHSG